MPWRQIKLHTPIYFQDRAAPGRLRLPRLLAKAVNCLNADLSARPCGECDHCKAVNQSRFLDLIEIDAASNTSVDDVRDLREKINFSPNQGIYKVYIIDEVHMLSSAAFNALLKTLEEPPPHAIFVLATTEVHKIPATVLSRCQRHEFRRIPIVDIVSYLSHISEAEGILVEEDALKLIARQSTGAMRDAISLLDQLSSTGKAITLELVQAVLGTAASQSVLDLLETLIAKDSAKGLECIHATLDSGCDPRQFSHQVVDYLRELLVMKMGDPRQVDATPEIDCSWASMLRHSPPRNCCGCCEFSMHLVWGRVAPGSNLHCRLRWRISKALQPEQPIPVSEASGNQTNWQSCRTAEII